MMFDMEPEALCTAGLVSCIRDLLMQLPVFYRVPLPRASQANTPETVTGMNIHQLLIFAPQFVGFVQPCLIYNITFTIWTD